MSDRAKSASAAQRSNSKNSTNKGGQNRPNSRGILGNEGSLQKKVVGNYMLGKTIGEGTFGKVQLAIHMPTGEKVAVKILEKSKIKESADVRRVNREIKILKKARHGNIIQLYEVLDTPNSIYLIMECAEGGEMFDYIVAHKYCTEVQACKFFHQIVDGVENLHKNDITHRDLKPENLLLKESCSGWLVKIVDFGLSNTHEGGKLLATACGSPCYAAPEMIAGKHYEGPLADLWSMGVILFALVCGYLPFEDPNTSVLYRKIMSGDYKSPAWISSEVKDLIRKILETDPKKRYKVEDIRKHSWYCRLLDSEIPREVLSQADDDVIKMETSKAMKEAGLDTQTAMDGVASLSCNSTTAMYYLFEQKFRNQRLNQTEAQNQLQNQKLLLHQQQSQQQQHPHISPRSNIKTIITGLTSNIDNQNNNNNIINRENGNDSSSNPGNSRQKMNALLNSKVPPLPPQKLASQQGQPQQQRPQTGPRPYHQAPNILIQQQIQQQQMQHQQIQVSNQRNDNMAMALGFANVNNPDMMNPSGNNVDPSRSKPKMKTPVITGNILVPRLNLRGAVREASDNNPLTLVSQSARPKTVGRIYQEAFTPSAMPSSARPVLPSDLFGQQGNLVISVMPAPDIIGSYPVDLDRPTTRRSKLRSRSGAEPTIEFDAEGEIPHAPTDIQNGLSNMNVNGIQAPIEVSSYHAVGDRDNNKDKNNIGVQNGREPNSIEINQAIQIKAPDMAQKSSAPPGGRRGKHLYTNAGAPNAEILSSANANGDANTQAMTPNSVELSAKDQALKNKSFAQGSIGPNGFR